MQYIYMYLGNWVVFRCRCNYLGHPWHGVDSGCGVHGGYPLNQLANGDAGV